MCTFILKLAVFLVISRTSALTARVTGVVRDWSVVLLSAAIFADTKLNFINIVGYAIGMQLMDLNCITVGVLYLRYSGPSVMVQ
jgi:hypothetical protein